MRPILPLTLLGALAARAGYRRLISGDVTLDLDVGRSTRRLGPFSVTIDAPRQVVWEVAASPYLGRQPAGMADKITILERGSDMVLAAHRTPVAKNLVATTLETVRFEDPDTIHFRLVRGPVPEVTETFTLHDVDGSTRLDYAGELATDLWAAGRWWGAQVARRWEDAVQQSMTQIRQRAEERATRQRARLS